MNNSDIKSILNILQVKFFESLKKWLIKESLYFQKFNLSMNIDKQSIPLYLFINLSLFYFILTIVAYI